MDTTETYLDLKSLRKAMGLRFQKQLADRMGVTVETIKHWEYARYNMPQSALMLLGHILLSLYKESADPLVSHWRHLLGEVAMKPWAN